MNSTAVAPLRVFISYRHADHRVLEAIRDHLGWLENDARILIFDDQAILAGEDWDARIRAELDAADIIILVVTAKFTRSAYCTKVELQNALERRSKEDTLIIPIIAETCDWAAMPILAIAALPKDKANNLKPLNKWRQDQDVALTQIAQHVRGQTTKLLSNKSRSNSPLYSAYSAPPLLEVRVMSALIRIASGDQYVLIRNLHRPESFSPLGGVYKYFRDARIKLDSLDFRPQVTDADMVSDLRGFLPYEQLDEFLNWFRHGHGRETAHECLCRELQEETAEVGIETEPDDLTGIRFAHVRTIQEGPEPVPAESYVQRRIFDVYDLVPESARGHDLVRKIQEHAVSGQDMIWASAQEIKRGRDRFGHLIGSTAPYLFGQQRYRGSDPPFVGG